MAAGRSGPRGSPPSAAGGQADHRVKPPAQLPVPAGPESNDQDPDQLHTGWDRPERHPAERVCAEDVSTTGFTGLPQRASLAAEHGLSGGATRAAPVRRATRAERGNRHASTIDEEWPRSGRADGSGGCLLAWKEARIPFPCQSGPKARPQVGRARRPVRGLPRHLRRGRPLAQRMDNLQTRLGLRGKVGRGRQRGRGRRVRRRLIAESQRPALGREPGIGGAIDGGPRPHGGHRSTSGRKDRSGEQRTYGPVQDRRISPGVSA